MPKYEELKITSVLGMGGQETYFSKLQRHTDVFNFIPLAKQNF